MKPVAYVTGATGFVGGHVARTLCEAGWAVHALVRAGSDVSGLRDLPLTLVHGDVTQPGSIRIPDGADGVFHVAADTSIWRGDRDRQTRVNVEGTRHLLVAARAAGAKRFIHTSTFAVWGFPDGVIDEQTPWQPGAEWINYIATKRAAETMVREAGEGDLDVVILNPAHILGPGDRHNWSRLFRMIQQGTLPGVPGGGGAFGDVREIARAHVTAFEKGRSGENYLLGGEETSMLDLVQKAGELLHAEVPAKPSPRWLLRAVGRVNQWRSAFTGRAPDLTPEGAAMITHHMHCDSSKAREELGYRFTAIDVLLEDTLAWLRSEGLLQ